MRRKVKPTTNRRRIWSWAHVDSESFPTLLWPYRLRLCLAPTAAVVRRPLLLPRLISAFTTYAASLSVEPPSAFAPPGARGAAPLQTAAPTGLEPSAEPPCGAAWCLCHRFTLAESRPAPTDLEPLLKTAAAVTIRCYFSKTLFWYNYIM